MVTFDPTRRGVLGAAAGAATLAIGAGAGVTLARVGGPGGLARSFDTDDDGDAEMVVRRETGAVGGRSGPFVHATTDGVETADYAVSLANVANRKWVLGDLVGSPSAFSYDYWESSSSTSPGPDEAWIVLHSRERGQQGRHILFRKESDTRARETWRTRNVAAEIEGGAPVGPSEEPWKEFHIDGRSTEPVGWNVLAKYGADARVKWVGLGRGSPGWASFEADTYYDDVTVAGADISLPVTVD